MSAGRSAAIRAAAWLRNASNSLCRSRRQRCILSASRPAVAIFQRFAQAAFAQQETERLERIIRSGHVAAAVLNDRLDRCCQTHRLVGSVRRLLEELQGW